LEHRRVHEPLELDLHHERSVRMQQLVELGKRALEFERAVEKLETIP
jgi:hypothetical protein